MPPKKTTSKAKSDAAAYQQLKADLAGGTPASLYFFFGEEVYLRDFYLGKLKELLIPQGLEDFNLHTLSGKECDPQTLADAIDALPMMSEHSMIQINDVDVFKSNEDTLKAYAALLTNLPEYVCVVFVYDLISMDKRTIKGDLGKYAKEHNALVQFSRQSTSDLVNWIQRRCKALGKDIDRTQSEYLIFVSGGLMTGLSTEIDKICAYAKEFSITKEDIDAVCDPVLDAVAFKMTDAIANGEFDQAAEVLSELFAMQQPHIMILGALGHQVRQLYTARIAVEQSKSASWLVDIWGMKQSWSAQRLLRNAQRFPRDWYRQAVVLVGETDKKLKLSYNEGEALLTELLVRLAEAAHLC
jgi:DNA polymerase-3 subunit delta